MPLAPGARLGSYEVVSPLGAGGMGEVYRATDTRLRRDVAIKVLPSSFAADAERLRRFEQEALATAALNHPNILTVYDVGKEAETAYVVLELLEGQTLRDMLGAGAVPARKAIDLAAQLANGLAAAHAKGIVHRDLKPENVFVTTDERVKILDFGLAKVGDAASPAASTVIGGATEPGTVMGTIGYMAPEQVRGQAVDHRADIFSFGAILYEMLSGRRAFGGETAADAMSAILKEAPTQLSGSGAAIPFALERVVFRCLEKNPAVRFQSASDLAFALGGDSSPAMTAGRTGIGASTTIEETRGTRGTVLAIGGIAAALMLGAAGAWMFKPVPVVDVPVRQFTIPTPDRLRVTFAAISPDGRSVAFASAGKSWVMRFDQGTPLEIPGAEGARTLFWSPDSAHLGFQVRGRLWRVPASGGTPVELGTVSREFSAAGGAAWLEGDRIWYTTGGSGLIEVSAQGGTARAVLDVDPKTDIDFHEPSPLPDGKGVLFVPHQAQAGSGVAQIDVFDGRIRRQVHRVASGTVRHPAYSPTGHLLYTSGVGVWAVRFSLDTMQTSGEPFPVAADHARPSVSADGTLVLVPEGAPTDLQLTWADRTGKITGTVGRGGLTLRMPRLSPDGRRVVVQVISAPNIDLFVFDVERGTDRRLTFENGADVFAVWSPNGEHIVYECGNAVCARRSDGSGERVVLVQAPAYQPALSPDGKYLLFERENNVSGLDVMMVPLGDTGLNAPPKATPQPFLAGHGRQGPVDISPDGKFAVYESLETGESEVYITSFPDARGKWQVSQSGGGTPRWSHSGDRVFFNNADRLFESVITRTPNPAPGQPVEVLNGPALGARITPFGFDRSLDGQRFLFPRSTTAAAENGFLRLIENWERARR